MALPYRERAQRHNGSVLSEKAISQPDAWRMIRRRAAAAGIAAPVGCHTFRAAGITAEGTGIIAPITL
jgi:integrase/recombinase XerD